MRAASNKEQASKSRFAEKRPEPVQNVFFRMCAKSAELFSDSGKLRWFIIDVLTLGPDWTLEIVARTTPVSDAGEGWLGTSFLIYPDSENCEEQLSREVWQRLPQPLHSYFAELIVRILGGRAFW